MVSKLPDTGTTIFTVMTELANRHGAINLSQGFPDIPTPPKLIELVSHYMQSGLNQYAPMPGVLQLREKIAEKVNELYHAKVDAQNEVTITAGGTQAIYTVITTLIQLGDEVILFAPAYDCYAPAIMVNGGKPIYVSLKAPDFAIDWEEVRGMVSTKTKLIIINTPHNPTGMVMAREDMLQLQALIDGKEIYVLSDEVYEHMVFDGQRHESVLRYPELAAQSFVVSSFGKTYHNTGWKIGYCIAPAKLMAEFRKVHQYLVFSVNHPMQRALADFMELREPYLQLSAFYQAKRDYFIDLLSPSRFRILKPKGTYFVLLEYSQLSEKSDTDFAIQLTQEIGVASIPISVFYPDNFDQKILRFCFAKQEDTLMKAAERLCKI
ncbi:MAG: methionine aminotransferase [Chitinophagales bacterium]|nr:methionine aminotransferase [Chitinophagales bacterium]